MMPLVAPRVDARKFLTGRRQTRIAAGAESVAKRLAISARTLVLTTLGSIAVMVLGVSAAVPAASTALHIVPTTPNQIAAAVRAPGAKATLVNVWATFCGPCRKEFPELVRLQRTWKPKGLRVMFVSADTDDQKAAVTSFLRHQGVRSEERRVGKECRSRW